MNKIACLRNVYIDPCIVSDNECGKRFYCQQNNSVRPAEYVLIDDYCLQYYEKPCLNQSRTSSTNGVNNIFSKKPNYHFS